MPNSPKPTPPRRQRPRVADVAWLERASHAAPIGTHFALTPPNPQRLGLGVLLDDRGQHYHYAPSLANVYSRAPIPRLPYYTPNSAECQRTDAMPRRAAASVLPGCRTKSVDAAVTGLRRRLLKGLREGLQSTRGELRAELVGNVLLTDDAVRSNLDGILLSAFRSGNLSQGILDLLKEGGPDVRDIGTQLEKLFGGGYLDPLALANAIPHLLRQTCQVLVAGDPSGTGFLIGPSHVLTACHVVRSRLGGAALRSHEDLGTRFDVVRGSKGDVEMGRHFAVTRIVAHRFPHPADEATVDTPFDNEPLDYAVLEIAPPIGLSRGWIDLTHAAPLHERSPLLVAQHPQRGPLRLAFANHAEHAPGDTRRVLHDAPTEPGSSGAPCLALVEHKLVPIAVHQGAGKEKNFAIRSTRIRDDLAARGLLSGHLQGTDQPPPPEARAELEAWLRAEPEHSPGRLARLVMALPASSLSELNVGRNTNEYVDSLAQVDANSLWRAHEVVKILPDGRIASGRPPLPRRVKLAAGITIATATIATAIGIDGHESRGPAKTITLGAFGFGDHESAPVDANNDSGRPASVSGDQPKNDNRKGAAASKATSAEASGRRTTPPLSGRPKSIAGAKVPVTSPPEAEGPQPASSQIFLKPRRDLDN